MNRKKCPQCNKDRPPESYLNQNPPEYKGAKGSCVICVGKKLNKRIRLQRQAFSENNERMGIK